MWKKKKKKTQKRSASSYMCVCVYICAFNLKFTASKGRLNAEQKREFRMRIKESQRGVFVCLFSFFVCCFLGRNLKKSKKKMDQRSE